MAWTGVVFPFPSTPDNPIPAGARSWRPRSSPNRLSSLAERRIGLELQELIAQHRRQLEIELLGGGLHLLLQHADESLALAGVGGAARLARTTLPAPRARDPRAEPDIQHPPHDGPRRAALRDVFGKLRFPAAIPLLPP